MCTAQHLEAPLLCKRALDRRITSLEHEWLQKEDLPQRRTDDEPRCCRAARRADHLQVASARQEHSTLHYMLRHQRPHRATHRRAEHRAAIRTPHALLSKRVGELAPSKYATLEAAH
eukprot:7391454-Prymnesium_polylepis.1